MTRKTIDLIAITGMFLGAFCYIISADKVSTCNSTLGQFGQAFDTHFHDSCIAASLIHYIGGLVTIACIIWLTIVLVVSFIEKERNKNSNAS